MTTIEWQQEFREELNELYIPALRLYIITKLYPYEIWPQDEITGILDALQKEQENEEQVGFNTLLNNLYRILALLPEPHADNELMNKRCELAELQQSALNQLIDLGINLKRITELPETDIQNSLENFANVCKHWKELLAPLQTTQKRLKQDTTDKKGNISPQMELSESSFTLKGQDEYSDEYAISITIDIARRLMKVKGVKPKQIVGLANAIYALHRLPQNTPGVDVEYSLTIEGSTKHSDGSYFAESSYLTFHITDQMFQISRGGFVDHGAGYDSYSNPGWYIEIDGFREAKCDLWKIEDEAVDMLGFLNNKNPRTKISVVDNSEIQFD